MRILGEVTKQAADILRLADHIFVEEPRRAGWYDKTSQAFVVFLPVKSVGVTGDGRRYEPGLSRVVYDISGKPPATIEWE